MSFDPVKLSIFKSLFHSIAEEMGATLRRTSFSPNIKERRDYSCALFDRRGQMVAQGDHMPVHLGSMPLSVASAIQSRKPGPGDMILLNDPFRGGTHLPDLTLVSGVFEGGKLLFYVASRAHHSDVGGMTPGSMPVAEEIYQEGLRLPPVRLMSRGQMNEDVLEVLLANVRTPREREGDLAAMIAANKTGERRLLEAVGKYGLAEVDRYIEELLAYTERMTRKVIWAIPDGSYRASDVLDDDGFGNRSVGIRVCVTVRGSDATVDFAGSDAQVRGSVNAVLAITSSAVFYVFRTLVDTPIPSTAGGMRPLRIVAPEGSVVNANPPAAVCGGNVETSQRIVDVLYRCLAPALPELIPAASQGTMNNVTFGGTDPESRSQFAYYETIAGGMGARPGLAGMSGVHTHMTNSMNTPVEALEYAYPVRMEKYALRRGSGGAGAFRGGDGVVRQLRFLVPVELTVLTERRLTSPYGLRGGKPGRRGRNTLCHADGTVERLAGKVTTTVRSGDALRVETPGGGGWGRPRSAKSARKRAD